MGIRRGSYKSPQQQASAERRQLAKNAAQEAERKRQQEESGQTINYSEGVLIPIKPPMPELNEDIDEFDEPIADDAAEKIQDLDGLKITGGGEIVVTGGGRDWVISNVPEEDKESDDIVEDDAATSPHPWLVSLSEDDGDTSATILEGLIYDGLLSITKITPTLHIDAVVSDSLVCLEYNYSTGAIQSIIVQEFNYEPSTDDGLDPPTILTSVQPIAKIANVDGVLTVEQIARNNFALTSACINGKILKVLRPL
tara:strand:- start:89 stop:850 length:762 start_codon:yes stop_codon:yes gene_type:complete